ncbi:MAG: hypothetical protein H6809_07770 [Phycisphaeraceae bacterium]|nr:hypothetical protein [Phycisphaeraceae bacterium]
MSKRAANTGAAAHPDGVFVRRCRVVCVGVVRFAVLGLAVALASDGLDMVVRIVSRLYYGSPAGLGWLAVIGPATRIGSLVLLWWVAPWVARRVIPEPPDPTRCPKCKYPLEGLDADTCPECGTRIR